MALNGLFCADVPLRNYSLTFWSIRDKPRGRWAGSTRNVLCEDARIMNYLLTYLLNYFHCCCISLSPVFKKCLTTRLFNQPCTVLSYHLCNLSLKISLQRCNFCRFLITTISVFALVMFAREGGTAVFILHGQTC